MPKYDLTIEGTRKRAEKVMTLVSGRETKHDPSNQNSAVILQVMWRMETAAHAAGVEEGRAERDTEIERLKAELASANYRLEIAGNEAAKQHVLLEVMG